MPSAGRHIQGLDCLRFLAALWVAFSHGAKLPLKHMLQDSGNFGHILAAANGVLFNGIAAVVVFFLISGFCIHFPWASAGYIDIRSHLTRRYIRIGLPLIVCYAIMYFFGSEAAYSINFVLWSIYCELIYYTIYPLIFLLFDKIGAKILIFAATIISCCLIYTHLSYLRPWEFGIQSAWLVALPAWLLGCLIAEKAVHQDFAVVGSIWLWRGIALVYTAAAEAALFHSRIPLGAPATMLIFSFYCYFWLQQELARYARRPPLTLLEWGGTWSYSIYLMHNMVITAFAGLHVSMPPLVGWTVQLLAILVTSYAFYAAFERPSHLLARRLGRAVSRPVRAAVQASNG